MHSTIFIFANFTFLWKVPSDVESTAAQDEARRAQRENSRAGRSHWMGTAVLPETQAVGKGLPGSGGALLLSPCVQGRDRAQPPLPSAPTALELRSGGGHGSCRTCRCPGQGWICARSTIPQHQQAPGSLPTEAVPCLGAGGTEQGVTQSGASKNSALALDGVDWHSPALCDEPRRLSMLSFLQHKGSLNVLTW